MLVALKKKFTLARKKLSISVVNIPYGYMLPKRLQSQDFRKATYSKDLVKVTTFKKVLPVWQNVN